jgi:hypothetical protein
MACWEFRSLSIHLPRETTAIQRSNLALEARVPQATTEPCVPKYSLEAHLTNSTSSRMPRTRLFLTFCLQAPCRWWRSAPLLACAKSNQMDLI